MSGTPAVDPSEVVILGAGPAGCSAALALRRAGISVCLVERQATLGAASARRAMPVGAWAGDAVPRIESATPDVRQMLARLAVPVPAQSVPYAGTVSVWGGQPTWRHFAQRGLPPGHLVDRAEFDRALREAAVAAGARLVDGAAVEALDRADGAWRLRVAALDRRQPAPGNAPLVMAPKVLIDATGRRAALATHMLGVGRSRVDRQLALQAVLPVPADWWPARRRCVMVEAAGDGWWSAVPGAEALVLSFMVDTGLARQYRHAAAWREALTATWLWREWLGQGGVPPSPGRAMAACSGCLRRSAGPGWLAIGDALMSLDPLSSSGISGAMRDGIDAVEQVVVPWLQGAGWAVPGRAWAARADRFWQRFLQEREAQRILAAWPASVEWPRVA
jgi:flavin-dependent dehydrogenase